MAKSTAKAEAVVRDLKDRLAFRGYSSTESKTAEGNPKLTVGSDASIEIVQADAVSKDIFGNDLLAFAPHQATLAIDEAIAYKKLAEVIAELSKVAIDKTLLKTSATDLATAEAIADASADAISWDVRWPTKGS